MCIRDRLITRIHYSGVPSADAIKHEVFFFAIFSRLVRGEGVCRKTQDETCTNNKRTEEREREKTIEKGLNGRPVCRIFEKRIKKKMQVGRTIST